MNQNPILKLMACSLAVLLLLSGSPAASQNQSTTTRATADRPERPFYWWPAYRGMLGGLTDEQAAKLGGIAASYGRLTRGLYMSMRAKKLDRAQYSPRLRQGRGRGQADRHHRRTGRR